MADIVRPPALMRGLWIPDPNFNWDLSTGPWTASTDVANNHAFYPSRVGTGRTLQVQLNPQNGDTLISGLTPYGVATGPYGSSVGSHNFWIGIIAKTKGCASNSNNLIQARIYDFDAAGTEGTNNGANVSFVDLAGAAFRESETDYSFYQAEIQTWAPASDARHFKLYLYFYDDSTAGDCFLHLDWVGLAHAYDRSGGVGSNFAVDELETYYTHDASMGRMAQVKMTSQVGSVNWQGFAPQRGVRYQNLSMNFPILTNNDRDLVERVASWNSGSPTEDVESNMIVSTGEDYLVNRGTPSPVIVRIDRAGCKRAFYADMRGAENIVPSALPGYWPGDEQRWQTSLSFTERP